MHTQQNIKLALYVERDSVAGSRKQCCSGKTTIRSSCIVELHATVHNTETPPYKTTKQQTKL
jgi:hypothetical protein